MRRGVRCGLGLGCAALLLVGCTYASEEPGLLRRTPADRGSRPTTEAPPTPPATNPELPVLAETVWTSADGLGVQVRIGVHAVRRISGATVLDWSVTPLAAPNLQTGDAVPAELDLSLSRTAGELPLIWLLDRRGDRLYRPLASPTDALRCVCTPLAPARAGFRIGHTTVLQVAFPALPPSATTVDVALATVAPFAQVPITPAGQVPVAVRPTQLARPPDSDPVAVAATEMFRYGPGEQIFRLRLHRVVAGASFTTLEWTIWSVTGGAGLDEASSPPFAEVAPGGPDDADRPRASGPALVVDASSGTQTLRTRLVTTDAGGGSSECVCTPLDGWTSVLGRPDKPAAVVTTYPPLPAGVRRVQVRFDGLTEISLPVTAAPDARRRAAGVRPWTPTTWRSAALRSGAAWSSQTWPTPVPATEELPVDPPGPYRFVR